jgi:hypothetical protein
MSTVEPALNGTMAWIALSFGHSAANAVREKAGAARAAEASDRRRRRLNVIVLVPRISRTSSGALVVPAHDDTGNGWGKWAGAEFYVASAA